MKDDEEQRIQRAMEMFSSSPMRALSSSPSPGVKAPESGGAAAAGALAIVSSIGAVGPSTSLPTCRPWDRGDLFRRMATFKSLSWFGKPTVAGPVACARRGWVNADYDLIACEVCGSRLSFSVPNNWTKQQAEAAGQVFSEKLDCGHKPGCPWKGNACGEELAAFVPTPAPALVQAYDERLQSLLSLSALPVVSSSAFEHLKITRDAQVKHLFSPPDDDFTRNLDAAQGEAVQKLREQYNSFCQAQKLISLCGWELRNLPYAVEPNESKSDAGLKVSVPVEKPGKAPGFTDPASVTLECPLCRASAGLWRFNMLSRSLLSLSTVLATIHSASSKKDVSEANAVGDDEPGSDEHLEASSSSGGLKEAPAPAGLDLSLTIAGGPRPTRLVYTSPASIPYPGHFNQQMPEEPADARSGGGSKRKHVEEEAEEEEPGKKKQKVAGDSAEMIESSGPENAGNNGDVSKANEVDSALVQARAQQVAKEALIISDTPSEFDPIHQHRYFCPWISSNSTSVSFSGWQLTIDALCSQANGISNSNSNNNTSNNNETPERAGVTRKIDALASVRKMLGGKGKGKTVVAAPV